MRCIGCESQAVIERPECTLQGYLLTKYVPAGSSQGLRISRCRADNPPDRKSSKNDAGSLWRRRLTQN